MSALVTYHGNLAVPDSRLAPPSTDYPVDRFSLYEYESLPSTQGTFGKEPGMDGLDQFFQDSTFDFFPGLDKQWDQTTLLSPLSLNQPPLSPPPPSHSLPSQPEELIDLGLFCEPGFTTDDGSTFSTLPPTPISAPLSPEEQEIQEIVSSFQDTPSTIPPSNYLALSPAASSPLYVQLSKPSNVSSDPPTTPPVSQFVLPNKFTFSPSPMKREQYQGQSDNDEQHSPRHSTFDSSRKTRSSRRKMPQSKRKERKKEQNKMAALRYRQKKKEEGRVVEERQEELEAINSDLKKQVSSLETEIKYLKQLWIEVHQARQQRQGRLN